MMAPRQGRSVVLLNAAITVVIVGLIAGVSVFKRPPAPPTIAEFAPANPARQLTEDTANPPSKRHDAPAGPIATPTAASGVPSALQCWSWPDGSTTQTFDRQSPPCVSSWNDVGGNGGSSTQGVTATEIRVGIPAASVSEWEPYAAFFSRHYQLYGRVIRLIPLGIQRLRSAEDQRAAAGSAAERQVFAALDDPTQGRDETPELDVYVDTLASDHIVAVLTGSTQISTTALSAAAPYSWSFQPAMDTTQRTLAAAICRELSGHHASYSKQTNSRNRRFTALVPAAGVNEGNSFDATTLTAGLDRCHVSARIAEYDPGDRLGLEDTLAQERRAGTTTLIPFGSALTVASALMPAAGRVSYVPEWLIPGLQPQKPADAWARAPGAQVRSLFGLAAWPRPAGESEIPAAQALHEVLPSATFDESDQAVYDGLALIAAGVQTAGPRLTARTFADGLTATTFANPAAGAAPSYQARVGFADIDHSMSDDFGQVWWSGSRFCMVGGGKRWTADEFPYADPGFFDSSRGC